jgi:hypothetical protein
MQPTLLSTVQAKTLEDIYKTISPKPLCDPAEFSAYYRPELNEVRGKERLERIILELERAHGGLHYKTLLMGHAGVGKSTEITGILDKVKNLYRPIRFNITDELDPVNFQPFDVLLWMMCRIAEETARPVADGGTGKNPSPDLLTRIWDWFSKETTATKETGTIGAGIEAGLGSSEGGILRKVLGLFAKIKGEMKYASVREKTKVDYRLSRLQELIDLANSLIKECDDLLRDTTGQEWIFVGEDFDKDAIPLSCILNLFVNSASMFRSLETHFIFNIPIQLGYSEKAEQLPVPTDRRIVLPDVPVYGNNAKRAPHKGGRQAIRAVLGVRVSPELFEAKQLERVIVASGGNIRDLFSLVAYASDMALIRKSANGKIGQQDVNKAIEVIRNEYRRRLGESRFDPEPISYDEKTRRLVQIYKREPKSDVTDKVLYSLLRSRAVQEFNGWFGVHPLVVDILADQKILRAGSKGALPGGAQ